jgi:hypothetical protein
MIASVTVAPRTSLAICRSALQGSPRLLTAARSLVNCRNCRRSQRAALPRDLTLRWIPRRRWQEPHRRAPSRSAGSEKTAARVTARVAISVAVQCRATQSSQDRPRMSVQPEPIRTVATRAANAVGPCGPPGRPAAPGGSVTAEVTVTRPNNDSPGLIATVARIKGRGIPPGSCPELIEKRSSSQQRRKARGPERPSARRQRRQDASDG